MRSTTDLEYNVEGHPPPTKINQIPLPAKITAKFPSLFLRSGNVPEERQGRLFHITVIYGRSPHVITMSVTTSWSYVPYS